jgi:hypothetical protein
MEQRTAAGIAYTRVMLSDNNKTLLLAGWAVVVCLAALALGTDSVRNWMVVASVAVVPPLVVRRFWRVPDQSISESIHNARR